MVFGEPGRLGMVGEVHNEDDEKCLSTWWPPKVDFGDELEEEVGVEGDCVVGVMGGIKEIEVELLLSCILWGGARGCMEWTTSVHTRAALGRLAHFLVRDWSSDGYELAAAARAWCGLFGASSPTSSSMSMMTTNAIACVHNSMGRYGFKDSEWNINTSVLRLLIGPQKFVCYWAHPALHMYTVRGEKEERELGGEMFSARGWVVNWLGVEWSTEKIN